MVREGSQEEVAFQLGVKWGGQVSINQGWRRGRERRRRTGRRQKELCGEQTTQLAQRE